MADINRAAHALERMYGLLNELSAPYYRVDLQAERGGSGRYERATNAYQSALERAYAGWVRGLLKSLSNDAATATKQIADALPDLTRALQDTAQAQMPNAIQAFGASYVPSPDAWQMLGEAIAQNNGDIAARLVPDVGDKLQRGVAEGADLKGVADSLLPRVALYAGNFWVLIQRLIGDFTAQAALRDDEIYPVQWVLDPQAQHCEACQQYAGTYENYNAMLEVTQQSVPGYFFNSTYKSCWGNCRCRLEVKINGRWQRI